MVATPSSPHIVLCLTDQQKATSLELYNRECTAARSRNLEALAEDGAVFDAAYCVYPLCVPSRIAMMTGRYPMSSGLIGNQPLLGGQADSLQGRLKAAGYRTYLAGKDHCFASPRSSGRAMPPELAARYDRGFLALHNRFQPPEVEEALPELVPFLLSRPELSTIWGAAKAPWGVEGTLTHLLADQAIRFIDEHLRDHPGRPFFLHWGPPDPHEFYQAPADIVERIGKNLTLPPNCHADVSDRAGFVRFMHGYFHAGPKPVSEQTLTHLYAVYLAMCEVVDVELGRVLHHLKARGIYDETAVVFASDHGDMCGELGLAQKWNGLYDGMTRVPLVVKPPRSSGGRRGVRCGDPVSLVDLAATVCGWAGVDAPDGNQGESWAGLLRGGEGREAAFLESGLPGRAMDESDLQAFPDHRWDSPAGDGVPYDPPHRWTGRCWGVRTRTHKLIVRTGQATELYDMAADPWETRNLAADPGLATVRCDLERRLLDHIGRQFPNPLGAVNFPRLDNLYEPGSGVVLSEPLHPEWQPGGAA